jgi:hypothetical protein
VAKAHKGCRPEEEEEEESNYKANIFIELRE